MPSDAELVQRCLEGDTEAYGHLVERYQGAVYAVAFHYAGRYGYAEDIAQDAFLAAYRSLPRLREPEFFAPWLREIASRTAANWLRKHGKRIDNETPLPYRRTISIEDVRRGPGWHAEREERYARLQAAISELPEHYRLPIVLRYLQELSYEQIANFTGQTRDEIRGVLQRASELLRERMNEKADDKAEYPKGGRKWRELNN